MVPEPTEAHARSRRFLIEFVGLTVGIQLLLPWLTSFALDPTQLRSISLGRLLSLIALAVAEWGVLRRYVPWAQWWALASLAGDGALSSLPFTLWYLTAASSAGLSSAGVTFVTLGSALIAAMLQYPTLRGRVPRAWVWLIAAPASRLLGQSASEWLMPFQTGRETGLPLLARTTIYVTPIAIVTGVTLMWLCREWLDRPAAAPHPRPYTRIEFLIAWCAVPMTVWSLLAAVDSSTGRDYLQFSLVVVPALFVLTLAAGQLWVLAGTGVDFRRWGLATLWGVGAFMVINFVTPFGGLLYWIILITKGGTLGLIPVLAQSFAFSTPARGVLWAFAAIVGWGSASWLSALVHTIAGPGESWRYGSITSPDMLGLVAGLFTGLALLPEIASPVVAASKPENPRKPRFVF